MNHVELRDLNVSDVPEIVEVHEKTFSDFFLTSLGKRFLVTYYSATISNKRSVAIGLFDSYGELHGFATGTYRSSGFHRSLLMQNIFQFFSSLLFVALTSPKVIIRLAKNINKKADEIDDNQYAELLSIAVKPSLKGLGYGKLLLEEFERKVKIHKLSRIALTTDLINNDSVIGFYNSCGYEVYYAFVAYPKRKMLKMIKVLTL